MTAYDKLGVVRGRTGNKAYQASPGDHYLTNDGRYLALTIAANNVFARLCEAMGRAELADDSRYRTHTARAQNYDGINGIVAEWIRRRPVDEVCASLRRHGVPHSLVYSPVEIVNDPHFAARGAIATLEHPRLGPLKMPAAVPRMSATPAPELRPAPMLGENTDAVLRELLGLSDQELADLRAQAVV